MNSSVLFISPTSEAITDYAADLHAHGDDYVCAEDVEQAYELIRAGLLPQTVIFDMALTPDAIALIQDMRRAFRKLAILVIGSSGADKALAHSLGVDAFLYHPLKPGRLAQVAGEFVS